MIFSEPHQMLHKRQHAINRIYYGIVQARVCLQGRVIVMFVLQCVLVSVNVSCSIQPFSWFCFNKLVTLADHCLVLELLNSVSLRSFVFITCWRLRAAHLKFRISHSLERLVHCGRRLRRSTSQYCSRSVQFRHKKNTNNGIQKYTLAKFSA